MPISGKPEIGGRWRALPSFEARLRRAPQDDGGGHEMTAAFPAPYPALPEITLALGARVLLMLGAYGGAKSTPAITTASFLLLVAAALFVYWLPAGRIVTFGGSFIIDDFARVLKILTLIGSTGTLVLARD